MSFYHPHPINRAWRLHTCCYVSLWSVWWPHTIISLMSGVSTDHLKCFQKNILLSVRFIYYFPSGRSSNYLKFFLHQTLSLFLSLSFSLSLSLFQQTSNYKIIRKFAHQNLNILQGRRLLLLMCKIFETNFLPNERSKANTAKNVLN